MNEGAFKSIGAVLAGLVAIIVLSNGTDTSRIPRVDGPRLPAVVSCDRNPLRS
jgi:hypothetical protein